MPEVPPSAKSQTTKDRNRILNGRIEWDSFLLSRLKHAWYSCGPGEWDGSTCGALTRDPARFTGRRMAIPTPNRDGERKRLETKRVPQRGTRVTIFLYYFT
ncbi:hypothetical protein TNCV_1567141 [Trichonephila clavipes]|nr:hypothetical protein TNCV_1567141 [Trichonephila clavipes]